jgi:hypothetical protein
MASISTTRRRAVRRFWPAVAAPLLLLLSVQSVHAGAVLHLRWTDNSVTEDGFSIERAPSMAGPFVQIGVTGPDATVYTDATVTMGKTYCYQVRAFNVTGASPPTNLACGVAHGLTTGDFDGDGKSDLAVFRQSTGQWFVFGSTTGFLGPVLFGAPGLGDVAGPADYDGDGKTDLAVYRATTAEWFVFGSATGFPGPVLLGAPGLGDVPVPADYDGDGRTDLAVYRTTSAQFFIFGSATGFPGPILFGTPGLGDTPVLIAPALRPG